MKQVEIVECTLRDGSYTVQDQFTAQDTANVVKELDQMGFKYIEIGPGIGVNAKSKKTLKPASEDIEYVRAAVKAREKAKIGMFFIPGIGRKEDIRQLSEEGLNFIRIGVEAANPAMAFEYVEYAKKFNLFATVNLMKTYAVGKNEFAALAQQASNIGADAIYIVDSAGGMLPSDIEEYIGAAKTLDSTVRIGFHGHNNLSMAVANTLKAVECGAEFIDTTICGLGRSSGNAITEKMLLILDRIGYKHNINIEELLVFSDKIIKPFLVNQIEASVDYVMGYSQFHSGYLDLIRKMADKYQVNPNTLIMEYAKIDKVNMNEQQLEELAQRITKFSPRAFNFSVDIQRAANSGDQLNILKAKFIEYKNKYNARIFFNMGRTYLRKESSISPVIHFSENIYFGSAEIAGDVKTAFKIYDSLKNIVDGFLIDSSLGLESFIPRDKYIQYNDAMVFANSIYNYLKEIAINDKKVTRVYLDVYDEVLKYLQIDCLGIKIVNKISEAEVLVIGKNQITQEIIDSAKCVRWVLVTLPGMISPQVAECKNDIKLLRLDFKIEIFSEILKGVNYRKLFTKEYGSRIIDGVTYCSGGFIGKIGSVVVNDINNRLQIYGISNGDGSISYKTTVNNTNKS